MDATTLTGIGLGLVAIGFIVPALMWVGFLILLLACFMK